MYTMLLLIPWSYPGGLQLCHTSGVSAMAWPGTFCISGTGSSLNCRLLCPQHSTCHCLLAFCLHPEPRFYNLALTSLLGTLALSSLMKVWTAVGTLIVRSPVVYWACIFFKCWMIDSSVPKGSDGDKGLTPVDSVSNVMLPGVLVLNSVCISITTNF